MTEIGVEHLRRTQSEGVHRLCGILALQRVGHIFLLGMHGDGEGESQGGQEESTCHSQ